MGDEEALSLEAQLAAITAKFAVDLEPLEKDRAMAAADLEALGPAFTESLAALKAKQDAAKADVVAFAEIGMEINALQMTTSCARDFHMQRISECDSKISRIVAFRTKEEDAAKAAAAPPPEEE